ncbi:bifunctional diguanylate cyclase/phosphodiesterase [Novosphingobium sp. RD2P27]|uniref:Bifunctional diguanylate cyclase/phosphodiesterase n=1 Tax=Novosphingobium kalidii TaxID=3230299 RepID=A0ABV2D411_9SPHN
MSAKMLQKVNDLKGLAQQDALTGLLNRMHFQQLVEHHLITPDAEHPHCLFFIDLDGFKTINDTLGHHVGDRLLQTIAERLRIATRTEDLPLATQGKGLEPQLYTARFGGDEFVVFLANGASGSIAQKMASRILRVLSEPVEVLGQSARVSASLGVAFFPRDGASYSSLLRAADAAMYHAKREGRQRCEFYNPSIEDAERRMAAEEQELRQALQRGELELYFQPQYDVETLGLRSVEALIRWNHPERGLLLPGTFMPVAERASMTTDVGEWVLGEAARKIAELERRGTPLQIAVNISPSHLEELSFVSLVRSTLQQTGASSHLLEIEVTEDVAMRDPELVADRLSQLSTMGVSISIDDFGTGYSNLASLIKLPFSKLKIDRSLLDVLESNGEAQILVQTIISMANCLGFHSVAEGVEREEQLQLLSAMGCDFLQGFYLSRPLSWAQLRIALNEQSDRSVNKGFRKAS